MSMAAKDICVPGQRICRLDENIKCGQGTYHNNGFVYSTLAGYLHKEQLQDSKILVEVRKNVETTIVPSLDALVTARVTNVSPRFCKCAILSVGRTLLRETFRGQIRKEDVRATEKDKVEMYKCFRPGDIVVARVSRSKWKEENDWYVDCDAGVRLGSGSFCYKTFQYLIGGENYLAWMRDLHPEKESSSLGDAQSYLLSTAENELGVVTATSEAGSTMVPISWCKMQCPKSLAEEFRKVAKVQPQFIQYTET